MTRGRFLVHHIMLRTLYNDLLGLVRAPASRVFLKTGQSQTLTIDDSGKHRSEAQPQKLSTAAHVASDGYPISTRGR